MISESLKINTTLTKLDLSCDEIWNNEYKYDNNTNNNNNKSNPKSYFWQTIPQKHTIYKDVTLGHWQLKGVGKSY